MLSDAVADVLADLGLKSGDVVLVHAGAFALSELADRPTSLLGATEALHAGFMKVLGPEGTVAAPGYFYNYARFGEPYIVEKSPPDAALGMYPRFLFSQPNIKRSLNPLANLLALGSSAETICEHRSAYGYGHNSPWERLLELDAYCVCFGASFQATTFAHHVETVVGVPHLYNKIHRTPVIAGGREVTLPVVTAVRYLKYGIAYNVGERWEAALVERNLLREFKKGRLNVQVVRMRDMKAVLADALTRDSYFMLRTPPSFVRGEIPDDGTTGAGPAPTRGG
jgi:aminoglycoside N3'-acetyltransferase